jgi:hypothetical protein
LNSFEALSLGKWVTGIGSYLEKKNMAFEIVFVFGVDRIVVLEDGAKLVRGFPAPGSPGARMPVPTSMHSQRVT